MSHVAYTTDNVIDTKVLIIKTNSLHMGKTQKHRANSLLQEKNNCFSDISLLSPSTLDEKDDEQETPI